MANARMSRRLGFGLLLTGAAMFVGAGPAFAAACLVGPTKATAASVAEAVSNPDAVLKAFPKGGVALTIKVRALAGTDSATLEPVLSLIPSASVAQASAIGSGLARAASACARIDPTYANLIDKKVHEVNSPEMLASFVSTSSDIQLASFGVVAGYDEAVAVVVATPNVVQANAAASTASTAASGRGVAPTAPISGQVEATVDAAASASAPSVNVAQAVNSSFSAGTPLDGNSAYTAPGTSIDLVSPN